MMIIEDNKHKLVLLRTLSPGSAFRGSASGLIFIVLDPTTTRGLEEVSKVMVASLGDGSMGWWAEDMSVIPVDAEVHIR